ncbi:histidine phosphatase family protein [Salipaludibacillus sp. LMS25]|jgi:alpha-ribazole phosphatase|uniref:histidine phosphatase family protein n=1 Tax=Salipaludibacillus sp. LMS25 TaxID=2924031 RepID=UPI0020D058FA|nr:histidine phosphatase family protein [Salipaludibacillus sp. LMS25]UTR13883.1 histidine phosphatase family protein [Salipaludibacillus sp. LMS25]
MGTAVNLELYVIRHGVTQWNMEKRYLGHSDEPVLHDSLRHLNKLKSIITEVGAPLLISSDLTRCQETMAYLFPHRHYIVEPQLREFNFGDWEGKTYDDLKDVAAYRQWLNNWEKESVPGGESGQVFSCRVNGWLMEDLPTLVADQDWETGTKSCVIVTHGGVIRYLIQVLTKDKDAFWQWNISHGEAVKLSCIYDKGEWRCSSLSVVPTRENDKL